MKNLAVKTLFFLYLLFPFFICANASDIFFKATVKTTSDESIPHVYLRIYIPGISQAVDSMFTNEQGYIERMLSINTGSSVDFTQIGTNLITKKLSPNIISQSKIETTIEYDYQGRPELYFTDISGKVLPNYSELTAGIYYYFLLFNDGMKSEMNRIVVTEKCLINVELIPANTKVFSHFKTSVTNLGVVDQFYVEFIKDGFVTKNDTILIDAEVITKNYQLTEAAKPTADFSFSGNLTVGEPVVFDASASVGANGENLVYSWNFGNDKKGQSVTIPHLYNTQGNYSVTLTVAGNFGATKSITKSITISAGPSPSQYTGVVNGYITDENQFNLSGVTATLVEGNVQAVSDNNGKVAFTNLPIGIPLHFKIC
jgi:PKD repeat protein